jgi:hypothetical protein
MRSGLAREVATLVALSLMLLAATNAVSQPAAGQRPTLAILPYSAGAGHEDQAALATEELRKELAASHYRMIETERVQELMHEIALSHSLDFDPSMALELGRLAAADYVCIGEVAMFGFHSTTALRVVKVEDARVVMADCMHAESGFSAGDCGEGIKHAVRKLVARIDAAFPIEGAVAAIRGKEILLNVGASAGVVEGMRFEVRAPGAWLRDPVTGTLLPRAESPDAELLAVRVSPSGTLVRIAKGSSPQAGDLVRSKPLPLGIKSVW